MYLSDKEVFITPFNKHQWIEDVVVDGDKKKRGLIPRDYMNHPVGSYPGIPPMKVTMEVIPEAEWSQRCADQIKAKRRTSDMILNSYGGKGYPSLDQNGQGYCWMYSGTGCIMAVRAIMNQPYVRLSAHAGACMVKDFHDQGGWGAEGVDRLIRFGQPSIEKWPEKSMSRQYDKPETWENALLHKITGTYMDLEIPQYDRNLSVAQYATCLLLNMPIVCDYNDWSHSVMGTDLVDGRTMRKFTRMESGKKATLKEFEFIWGFDTAANGFGVRHRNSWTDSYGERGFGVRTGNLAFPDGGCAIWATQPSVN